MKIFDQQIDERTHLGRQVLAVRIVASIENCCRRKSSRTGTSAPDFKSSIKNGVGAHIALARNTRHAMDGTVCFQISRHTHRKISIRACEHPFLSVFTVSGVVEDQAVVFGQL